MDNFLIFDFDGTIVDSRELVRALYNEIAERENYIKINQVDVANLSNLSINERCKELNLPLYKIPSIALEVRKKYKRQLPKLKMKNEVSLLLHNLKKAGFRLGIISSNDKSNIVEFLQVNNLNIFDSIFSENNLFGKHQAISKFIRKHNLQVSDAIYIGDEVRDVVACKKVGIKVIAVTWGYDSLGFLLENDPNFIANSAEEISDIVNNYFKKI